MLQPNAQTDPITQILILAYRRGLALRQQQEEQNKNQTVDSDNLGGAALSTAQQQDPKERSLTNEF